MGCIEGEVPEFVVRSSSILFNKRLSLISSIEDKFPLILEDFNFEDNVVLPLLPPVSLWPRKDGEIRNMLKAIEPKINLLISAVFEINEGDEIVNINELQKRRWEHLKKFSADLSTSKAQKPFIYKRLVEKIDKSLSREIVNRYDFDKSEIWKYIEE